MSESGSCLCGSVNLEYKSEPNFFFYAIVQIVKKLQAALLPQLLAFQKMIL